MKRKVSSKLIIIVSLVAALAILAPVISGCFPGRPAPEVKPIKIAVTTGVTGGFSAHAVHHVRSAQMVVEEANARGGVLGRPVELVIFDVGDCSAGELIAARDALKAADVDVNFTMWWISAIASQYMLETGIPMIQQGWVSEDWDAAWEVKDQYPNFLFMNRDELGYGAPYFQALTNPELIPWEFPNKKAAILTAEGEYNARIAASWRGEAEKAGWEIILEETHPWFTTDYSPQMARIREEEPAIIFFNSSIAVEPIAAFSDFLEDPTNSLFALIWVIQQPEFKDTFGTDANGVIGTLPGVDFMATEYKGTNPQYMTHYEKGKAFNEAYIARYGETAGIAAHIAQDAFWAWAEAVERVGDSRDFDGVIKDMEEHYYVGITGRYGFDPEIKAGHYGAENIPITYYQMQDGEVQVMGLGAGRDVEIITPFQLPHWIE